MSPENGLFLPAVADRRENQILIQTMRRPQVIVTDIAVNELILEREGVKFAEFEQWRLALEEGGTASTATTRRIRKLERELARKEKALAEAAALLVLKKTIESVYYDEDEDTDETSEN